MRFRALCAATVLGLAANAPLLAASEALPDSSSSRAVSVPRVLSSEERDSYRAIFAAIRAEDWTGAAAKIDAAGAGPLSDVARAELYLAKNSPKVELEPLLALLRSAGDIPQAPQLAALAKKRGATADDLAALPVERKLAWLGGAPRRRSAEAIKTDAIAADLSLKAMPLLKADQPQAAEALLDQVDGQLSREALTEWQQRIAWTYFLEGYDKDAARLADKARQGVGDWAVQADWVAGLAAWRQRDCETAGKAFASVASRSTDSEMTAAGQFWTARAEMACGHPERVQARMRSAARLPETFYGLLASGYLGIAPPSPERRPTLASSDVELLKERPNIRRALALFEIGEAKLACEMIKREAKIGDPSEHGPMLRLANALDLPNLQLWLAQNGPAGTQVATAARYPEPGWSPPSGWRVDKALIYAHALQETRFQTDAVSSAGAVGALQVLPSTQALVARKRGTSADPTELTDPAKNVDYAQAYLEQLRDNAGTNGLLPKVIAAYNAGPNNVVRWNGTTRDGGDPLLFIESIPYAETRTYVACVLRNYWMYERQAGERSASLKAMAQGLWPRFPGLPGQTALRLTGISGGGLARAN